MDLQCWPLLTALAALVAALAYVRRKLSEPVRVMTEWMKRVHAEGGASAGDLPKKGLLAPLAREAQALASDLSRAQEIARREASLRRAGDSLWTAQRLREAVRENNVYRWAGELITELSSVRLELSARP